MRKAGPVVWILIAVAVVFGGLTFRRLANRAVRAIPGMTATPAVTFDEEIAATREYRPWQPTGTPGGQFDWEDPQANADRPFVNPNFTSPRTLDQTTAFVAWAMNRYFYGAREHTLISRVRFNGCEWSWNYKWYTGDSVNDYDRKMNLRDIKVDHVQASRGSFQASPEQDIPETFRRWDRQGSRMVQAGSPNTGIHESSIQMTYQETEHIGIRVAYALVHAAKLCGAKPEPQR